ncbi:MAG: hypothetical protein IIA87_00560 [Nanoarchaeota archaeon]|nr:hypothetical protein [Nanoarchaeota archaeon]
MEEVRSGIFRLEDGIVNPSEKQLVVVHPWYEDNHGSRSKDYLLNIERLLNDYDGQVIVLEEDRNLESTVERFLGFDRTDGRYFVFTEEDDAESADDIASEEFELINTDWEELADFIRPMGKEVRYAGGFFWGNVKPHPAIAEATWRNHNGCLGNAYEELKSRGITGEAVPGCVF